MQAWKKQEEANLIWERGSYQNWQTQQQDRGNEREEERSERRGRNSRDNLIEQARERTDGIIRDRERKGKESKNRDRQATTRTDHKKYDRKG